jgi:hypothetical protein
LLQKFVVIDPDNEADNLDRPAPTMAPTNFPRATKVIACANVAPEVYALSTIFNYEYVVELDAPSSNVSTLVKETRLPAVVSGASVEAVAEIACSNPCVVSISVGPDDTYNGECVESATLQQSCSLYDGSIKVVHTPECEKQTVRINVMAALKNGFQTQDFYDSINGRGVGATVTNVSLYFAAAPPTPDPSVISGIQGDTFFTTTGGGISTGGKVMVAFGSLALLALVVALFCIFFAWRRSIEQRQKQLDEDGRSLATDWSLPTDDNSFLKPDFYDLALRHSKLDVHQCHSALCEVCRPTLGVVNMISVSRAGDTWNGPVPRVLSSDLAPEAYGLDANDIDEHGFPIKEIDSLRALSPMLDHERSYNPYETSFEDEPDTSLDTSFERGESSLSVVSLNRSGASRGSLLHDTEEGFNFVRVAHPRQAEEWNRYSGNAVIL